MVYHGIPWYTMAYHGIPWHTMAYHGVPWYTMVYHGIHHGIPWYTIVYHGIPLYTMIYHCIPWYTMVCHSIPWYTMVYIMVYHGIYHGVQWYDSRTLSPTHLKGKYINPARWGTKSTMPTHIVFVLLCRRIMLRTRPGQQRAAQRWCGTMWTFLCPLSRWMVLRVNYKFQYILGGISPVGHKIRNLPSLRPIRATNGGGGHLPHHSALVLGSPARV